MSFRPPSTKDSYYHTFSRIQRHNLLRERPCAGCSTERVLLRAAGWIIARDRRTSLNSLRYDGGRIIGEFRGWLLKSALEGTYPVHGESLATFCEPVNEHTSRHERAWRRLRYCRISRLNASSRLSPSARTASRTFR